MIGSDEKSFWRPLCRYTQQNFSEYVVKVFEWYVSRDKVK
jgi:hypothetical protein